MLDSFLKAFEAVVLEFSARRVVAMLLLIGLGIGCFGIFEWYTSYFHLSRLERVEALLERLSALDAAARPTNEDLKTLRSNVAIQAKDLLVPSTPSKGSPLHVFWKFVAGFAPWALFALVYLPTARREPSEWIGVLGALFFGVCFGFMGLLIPNSWATFGILVSLSIGHFFLVVFLILVWQARAKAKTRSA